MYTHTCDPSKWNGLLFKSLKKIIEQVHPSLTASDEALEYTEMLVIQCLEKITMYSPQPKTINDVEDQVKQTFPTPMEKWAIKDAKDALERLKKKSTLIFPADKIHNLVQREMLQYKVDFQVALYITAILEYIATDVLKLAGNYVKNMNHVDIISFQDLRIAISGDKILMDLFGQHESNDLSAYNLGMDKIQRTATTYAEVLRDFMHDKKQFIRDLHLILKIFKQQIDRIIPTGSNKKLDSMFTNITDICEISRLFLSTIEDILEIAEDESATVGCCIEELAEAAEFDVFARYANDIVKKQCREICFELLNNPKVSYVLQSAGYGIKEAVRYYFPKLLLLPLWHCMIFFEYIKMLHQLSPSQHDKECLEQVEGMLRPLQLQMTSAANEVNLSDNVKEFGLKINAIPRRLLTIEKLEEVQKSIDGWDGKDMGQCCTEFIREGILKKILNGGKRCVERKAILFDGVLLLCRSNNRRHTAAVSSQLVSNMSEFKLKEKLFIRKVEIVDREDTEETKYFFEIAPRLQPPIILVASSFQEKANWMADLVMLNTKSMLDRTLNSILHDEDKKFPLRLPSMDKYRFVEPDSNLNIIIEEKRNEGVPLIKGATLIKLIERLTYHIYADPKFVKTFLTTYRSFCSPHKLLDLLIERYNIPEPFDVTIDSIQFRDEITRFRKKYLIPVQFRVLIVIRHWVDYHYYDYQRDQNLLDKLYAFLDSINGKAMKKWADSVIKILQRKTTEVQKEITFAFNSPPPPIEHHMDFNENEEFNILLVHPLEFARQLTLIESEYYRAVKSSELVETVWPTKYKNINSPNLSRLKKHTNMLIFWIEKVIVECENFEERVAVMSRFIEIMMALDEINNFNGVLSIHSAMQSAAIFRLKSTKAALNASHEKALRDAQEYVDKHFEKYNVKLRSINPPCVPFMGKYLTHIVQIGVGNKDIRDWDHSVLINFNKRRQVTEIIGEIQQFQNQPYCLNEEPKIRKFILYLNPLKGMDDKEFEDYLYNKSVDIEPKTKQLKPSKYPRKWPELNLKSPGIKPKVRVSLPSYNEVDIQSKRLFRLNPPSSLVIYIKKGEESDSDFSPATFTLGKNPNEVPAVPPRLGIKDKEPSPIVLSSPPCPPLPPKSLLPISNCNSPNDPLLKTFHFPKQDNNLEFSGEISFPITKIGPWLPLKPFVLKRTAPSMFQFNVKTNKV